MVSCYLRLSILMLLRTYIALHIRFQSATISISVMPLIELLIFVAPDQIDRGRYCRRHSHSAMRFLPHIEVSSQSPDNLSCASDGFQTLHFPWILPHPCPKVACESSRHRARWIVRQSPRPRERSSDHGGTGCTHQISQTWQVQSFVVPFVAWTERVIDCYHLGDFVPDQRRGRCNIQRLGRWAKAVSHFCFWKYCKSPSIILEAPQLTCWLLVSRGRQRYGRRYLANVCVLLSRNTMSLSRAAQAIFFLWKPNDDWLLLLSCLHPTVQPNWLRFFLNKSVLCSWSWFIGVKPGAKKEKGKSVCVAAIRASTHSTKHVENLVSVLRPRSRRPTSPKGVSDRCGT